MANKTSIEWTDYNWNFLRGCSRVSEGCRNCYAEGVAARFSGEGMPYEGLAKFVDHKPRWTGEIGFFEDVLLQPLRWKKPRRVFVNSMSDLFHEKVKDEWLDKAFAVMALTPQHTYQILTKRPERMFDYFQGMLSREARLREFLIQMGIVKNDAWSNSLPRKARIEHLPLKNVWLGVSVEDQKTANERIPLLLRIPATVRWLSCEPLLGEIDIRPFLFDDPLIKKCWKCGFFTNGNSDMTCPNDGEFLEGDRYVQWVVAGGESGPNARPMHPDWARSLCDQCTAAGVPFFFKQWGQWGELRIKGPAIATAYDHEIVWPDGTTGSGSMDENGGLGASMFKMGKKTAGRLLYGREWNQFPNEARDA
jgi:protein gp37